jgi:hypothetical protein
MSAEAKQHHYIPQCYLRGFLPPDEKKSKLTVLDLRKRVSFRTGTRNIGGECNFNRIRARDVSPSSLESGLSQFETMAADALRTLSEGQSLADEHTLLVLLNLIALLAIRNPQVRENLSNSLAQLSKTLLHMTLSTKEQWEHTMRGVKGRGIPVDDNISYEEIRDFFKSGEYKIETPTETHIFYEFHGIDAVLPFLLNRTWSLIATGGTTGPFVTCDRPVSIWWKHPEEIPPAFRCSPGFAMKDTIVLFPISSHMLMAGEFEESDRVFPAEGVLVANKELVAHMNSQIILFAARWIYASDLSFSFIDYATGKLRPGSDLFDCLRKTAPVKECPGRAE